MPKVPKLVHAQESQISLLFSSFAFFKSPGNFLRVKATLFLQSNQVKRTPQDSISELIIWKMNPLVVPVTGVKFKAAFLQA